MTACLQEWMFMPRFETGVSSPPGGCCLETGAETLDPHLAQPADFPYSAGVMGLSLMAAVEAGYPMANGLMSRTAYLAP